MKVVIIILSFGLILFLDILTYMNVCKIYAKNVNVFKRDMTKPFLQEMQRHLKMLIDTLKNGMNDIKPKQWIFLLMISFAGAATAALIVFDFGDMIICGKVIVMSIVLSMVTITDWYSYRIPNVFIVSVLSIRTILFLPEYIIDKELFKQSLISSLLGLFVGMFVLLILSFVSKGGLGMGDVKILGGIGYMLGIPALFYSMFFGMIACMFYSIFLLIVKKKSKKDEIPFGPFIYLGYALTILLKMF